MDDDERMPRDAAVWVTAIQRRGTVTLPAEVRQTMDLPDGSRLLVTRPAADTLVARVLPPSAVWFARFDDRGRRRPPRI